MFVSTHTKRGFLKYRAALMLLRGYDVADIAEELGLSQETVKGYLKDISKEATEKAKELFERELLSFLVHHNKVRIGELWRVYDAAFDVSQFGVSTLVLRALREEDRHLFEIGQSLGLVHKEPEKISVAGMTREQMEEIVRRGLELRETLRRRIEQIGLGTPESGSGNEGEPPGLLPPKPETDAVPPESGT